MPGPAPPVLLSHFHNLAVSDCGTKICGLYSAQYTLNRSIKSIFSPGSSTPIATYGELPNIELSYSQYLDFAGPPNSSEFNSIKKIDLQNRGGSVVADLAMLTRLSYSFTIDGAFLVTKTYSGYGKPSSGGGAGSQPCKDDEPRIFKRQDYSGSSPPGINSSILTGVSVDISVNRQIIPEFATRKPYASYVSFPITSSIKYDVYTEGVDSHTMDAFQQACGDPNSTTHSLSAGACGVSVSITKAYITDITYSGGDATKGSQPQTASITFTSYESIPGIQPVLIFGSDPPC